MQQNNSSYIVLIATIAAISGLLIGYDTAVISGAIEHLQTHFGLGDFGKGQATGSALIGCVFGGLSAGVAANKLGRKKALIVSAILFFVSALGSAFPGSFSGFIVFRMIGGVGVGMSAVVSTMYIGEISPKSKRGLYISFYQMAVVIGIFGVLFLNYAIAKGQPLEWLDAYGWRWMLGSETIIAGLFLLLLFIVPNSPRWLVEKGREEEAKKVLDKIQTEDAAEVVLSDIKESIKRQEESKSVGWSYIKKNGLTIALMVGIALSVFQQLVGINAVMYYAPTIFEKMGYSKDDSLIQTVIGGAVNLIFTIVALYTIDKLGRKPLLLWGSVLMGVFMFLLGWNVMTSNLGVSTLIYMFGFVAAFAVSWGPVVWVMIAEMYPLKVKGFAMAIAIGAQYVANYLVSSSFPVLQERVAPETFNGSFPYFFYGVCAFISWWIIKKYAIETKGKTLEEIEQLITKKG